MIVNYHKIKICFLEAQKAKNLVAIVIKQKIVPRFMDLKVKDKIMARGDNSIHWISDSC